MSDLINENERKAFLPEFPEDKIKRLEAENKRLNAEFKNLREEYIERQEWGAEQSMAVIKERDARIEQLEGDKKKDCCDFFRWFWNQPGTNAEQGYDSWIAALKEDE